CSSTASARRKPCWPRTPPGSPRWPGRPAWCPACSEPTSGAGDLVVLLQPLAEALLVLLLGDRGRQLQRPHGGEEGDVVGLALAHDALHRDRGLFAVLLVPGLAGGDHRRLVPGVLAHTDHADARRLGAI